MSRPATPDAKHMIFSYGTLRQPDVQRAIFGRELEARDDALTGFRVGMVTISNPEVVQLSGSEKHPGLTPTRDPSDRVAGVALAVTAKEIAAADAYESADYIRVRVTLESGTPAFVYLARHDA